MLDRLRGEADAIALLTTVPGIGRVLAARLHDELGLETLADLEAAAHDGRLETLAGFGAKRLAGIRDSLAQRLGRVTIPPTATRPPSVAELLDVDREYREKADAGQLQRITPRGFNPAGEAWLPVLHTRRRPRGGVRGVRSGVVAIGQRSPRRQPLIQLPRSSPHNREIVRVAW